MAASNVVDELVNVPYPVAGESMKELEQWMWEPRRNFMAVRGKLAKKEQWRVEQWSPQKRNGVEAVRHQWEDVLRTQLLAYLEPLQYGTSGRKYLPAESQRGVETWAVSALAVMRQLETQFPSAFEPAF